jgi:cardiolipin synthase
VENFSRLVFDEQYFDVCLTLLRSARESIYLSTFLVNLQTYRKHEKARELLEALKDAAYRGVDVKILLNRYQPQKKVTKLNDLAAKYLFVAGIEARFLPNNRCCHAKFIVVDKRTLLLGSHNWTRKALERNFELSLFLDDEILACELSEWFLRLFFKGGSF